MTPQEVKAAFRARGESVGSWADKHNFRRQDVYRVINGRTPCWRGETHRIAVALGIKPEPRSQIL